jgi:hypothetical protein
MVALVLVLVAFAVNQFSPWVPEHARVWRLLDTDDSVALCR